MDTDQFATVISDLPSIRWMGCVAHNYWDDGLMTAPCCWLLCTACAPSGIGGVRDEVLE